LAPTLTRRSTRTPPRSCSCQGLGEPVSLASRAAPPGAGPVSSALGWSSRRSTRRHVLWRHPTPPLIAPTHCALQQVRPADIRGPSPVIITIGNRAKPCAATFKGRIPRRSTGRTSNRPSRLTQGPSPRHHHQWEPDKRKAPRHEKPAPTGGLGSTA